MKLLEFLNSKPLYYKKINYKRMPDIYAKYREFLPLKPIIHIVGTNGKGSTGRWLALMLKEAGYKVGHYTSPHILEYNERFWIDGKNADEELLDKNHKKLFDILGDDRELLSYFEYSTLLAPLVFSDCDFVIFEAGLGGEYDATNVFEKALSIITPIGFDHEDFLGDTLEKISTTKINSIETNTIISPQNSDEILQIAKKIANKKNINLIQIDDDFYHDNLSNIEEYCKRYGYPEFFQDNLFTALRAASELQIEVDFGTLPPLDLRGRFEKIADNITLDVGHNPLSAKKISQCFKEKKVILIYNSFEDKDIYEILLNLKPIILWVELIKFSAKDRKIGEERVIEVLKQLGIKYKYFEKDVNKRYDYLVYGSFHVSESFLKMEYER